MEDIVRMNGNLMTNREYHLNIRFNKKELDMLDTVCGHYGLPRNETIRQLIRDAVRDL